LSADRFKTLIIKSYPNEDGNSLYNQAYRHFKPLNIYGTATTEGGIRTTDLNIRRVFHGLSVYFNLKSLNDLSYGVFEKALDLIKEPKYAYHKDIPEGTKIAFRRIAKILDYNESSTRFSEYAKIHRKTLAGYSLEDFRKKHGSSESALQWVSFIQEYIDQIQNKSTKTTRRALNGFLKYLENRYDPIPSPIEYLSKARHNEFVEKYKQQYPKYREHLTYLFRFSEYVINTYMSEFDEDGSIRLGYPIVTESQLYSDLHRASKKKNFQSNKLVIPTNILFLMRDIILENNFAFPKSLASHYFDYFDNNTGKNIRVFNPVAAYVLLVMLEIPVRKIQVQMLDSGEGDVVRYQGRNWVENTSPQANYWKARSFSRINRGILTKIKLNDRYAAGFYINTNKTADIKVGFGEDSGYIIPWNNEVLISYFQELRAFQEKYNPCLTPKKYKDIDISFLHNDGIPSKAILEQIPDRFYLFRNPNGDDPASPISSNVIHRFFLEILYEAEKRLNSDGFPIKIIEKFNPKSGQPERAIYTPHGLRVAGLTAMAESGVPIEILSKIIAGHSSILMTLHYIIYSDRKVSETLSTARKDIEANAKKSLQNWLKDTAFEDAKKYLAANNNNSIIQLLENVDAAFVSGNYYGLCPYAGTRCHDGGDLIKKETKTTKAKYGPVKGGKKNCAMCRHFVTGKPWMFELWIHTNKLLESICFLSKELDKFKEDKKLKTKQRYEFVKKQQQHLIPITLIDEIKQLDAILEEKSEFLNDVIDSAHASYNLLEEVKKIPDTKQDNVPHERLELTSQGEAKYYSEFIEASSFASQHFLVSASRLYPQFEDARVEMERNAFIDQIYAHNGLVPLSLAPLTEEEKKSALDASSTYLLEKLSQIELEQLHKGTVKLESLNISASELTEKETATVKMLGVNNDKSPNTKK